MSLRSRPKCQTELPQDPCILADKGHMAEYQPDCKGQQRCFRREPAATRLRNELRWDRGGSPARRPNGGCQMSLEVPGLGRNQLLEGVEIGGVASYLQRATESTVTLFG